MSDGTDVTPRRATRSSSAPGRRRQLVAVLLLALAISAASLGTESVIAKLLAVLATALEIEQIIFSALLHTVLAWTLAGLVLAITIITAAQWRLLRRPELIIPACFLFFVMLLDGLIALAVWVPAVGSPAAEATVLFIWTLSRLVFAFAILTTPWAIDAVRSTPQALRWVLPTIAVLGGLGTWQALAGLTGTTVPEVFFPGWLVVRPWELPPLVIFVGVGLLAWRESYRKVPRPLLQAIGLSLIPQAISQLEAAFGWQALYDAHFFAAQVQKGLGYALLLGGLIAYSATEQARQRNLLRRARDAQRKLNTRTQELARTDRELLIEARNRERAEQTLRTLQKAVETMRLGVTITDLEGRILFVNPAEATMHGYEVDELINREARLFGPPQTHRPIAPSSKGAWARETLNITRDGRTFPVRLVSDLVRDADDQPVAQVTISEDISERLRIDRMKQEFIETVSHELRTPLTSIIAALGLLRSGQLTQSPARLEELMNIAQRNSNRLLHMINDLLDLQKLSAGKMDLRIEAIAVQLFLRDAVQNVEAMAKGQEVELVLRADDDVEVLADRIRLTQVVENLLSNAIKASPARGEVVVTTAIEEDEIVVSVADRGPGIPPSFQARIFDRFAQADATERRESGGSGLGLSIVKGMVDAMGGTVRFDTGPQQGTTFYVSLPRPLSERTKVAS